MPLKIAILASGRGSNAKALIEAIEAKTLDATVQCLIANVDGAPVLDIARQHGLEAHLVAHRGLSREQHEANLLAILEGYEIDYLVLAGYMRMITPEFLAKFKGEHHFRILNIHPSLLPAFPGTNGYEDAYHYGVKVSGVTVHFVDEGMDNGPILLQEAFPRLDGDTIESFKARGLALEHQVYPKSLQLLAEKRVCFRYNPMLKRSYVEVKAHVPC